jgi:hypothetical protein
MEYKCIGCEHNRQCFIELQHGYNKCYKYKQDLDKYKQIIDKIKETINYYAIENEDYSKIYNQEEQEIMKLLEEIE